MFTIISTILSIIILELILSIDNAVVNASFSKSLPSHIQKKGVYTGIAVGAVLRIFCILIASILIENGIIKLIGGFYLLWLAYSHFFRSPKEVKDLDKHPDFWKVIAQIGAVDLVLNIDTIASTGATSTSWGYVMFAVLVGIIAMIWITPMMLRSIHKTPTLLKTTYGIIAYIGFVIVLDSVLGIHPTPLFTCILILLAISLTVRYDKLKKSDPLSVR